MSNSFVADDIDDSVIGTSKIFKFCIRLDLWSRKTGLIGITVPFVFVNYESFGSIFIFSILGFPTFVNILTYQLRECKRLTCFKNDKNFSWMVKRVRFFTWRGSRFGPAIKRPPQISVELPIRNRRPLEKIFRNWGQGRPSRHSSANKFTKLARCGGALMVSAHDFFPTNWVYGHFYLFSYFSYNFG